MAAGGRDLHVGEMTQAIARTSPAAMMARE
jgi:hypothetical protein